MLWLYLDAMIDSFTDKIQIQKWYQEAERWYIVKLEITAATSSTVLLPTTILDVAAVSPIFTTCAYALQIMLGCTALTAVTSLEVVFLFLQHEKLSH